MNELRYYNMNIRNICLHLVNSEIDRMEIHCHVQILNRGKVMLTLNHGIFLFSGTVEPV